MKYNSSREYLSKFLKEYSRLVDKDFKVLDAGAGDSPYGKFFKHTNYECADFCQDKNKNYEQINYVCDLTKIPVENNKYDLILLTQVLEHVPEPEKVLKELFRVLKPNGKMIISVPFFYQEHDEPFDFYRYTQYGLKYILEKNGYKIISINWLEGFFGSLSYIMNVASYSLPMNPKHYGKSMKKYFWAGLSFFFFRPLFKLFYLLFYHIDAKIKYTQSGFCKNYLLIAQK